MEFLGFKPPSNFATYSPPPAPISPEQQLKDTMKKDMSTVDMPPKINLMDAISDRQMNVFTHDGSGNWARAMRQFNFIEGLYRLSVMGKYEDVEGFDPMAHPSMAEIPDMQKYRFMNVGSEAELMQKIQWWKDDTEDMAMLMSGPSLYPILTAAILSPSSLAPLAPLKYFKASQAWKRFGGGAVFTTAIVAPEELLMASTIESRDAGHVALSLGAASVVGGTLNVVFGGKRKIVYAPHKVLESQPQLYKPVGASVNPEKARETARATMEGDALSETGIGLEKLGWNPVIRLFKSNNYIAKGIAPKLVDIGGMVQKKVRGKIPEATDQSIETTFRVRWHQGLLNSMNQLDINYLKYRNLVPKEGDIARSLQLIRQTASDLMGGRGAFLTQAEFRVRVSQAMRRGDKDPINDQATPFVNQSAKEFRKHFDDIKDQATEVKLFERQAQKLISGLQSQLNSALKNRNSTKAQIDALKSKITVATENLKKLRENGVTSGNSKSYLPRIYRVDKILANQNEFLAIIKNHFIKQGMKDKEAQKAADGVLDQAIHSKPWYDPDDASQIDWITQAGSSKARSLTISDELIEEFLENDAESLIRHYTKTMGTDIELTRAFGDINMRSVLDEIAEEYRKLIDDAKDSDTRLLLKNQMENDIRDIKGLRDRLRGTYGASKDPHQISSRFIRAMKSFNILVGMGSATLSSMPDIARTVMTEGMLNFHEKGLKNLFKNSKSIIKRMIAKELKQASISADAQLGLRASAFSDIGDLFGSRMAFERGLNKSTGLFFLANGLNYWNQFIKSFAGGVIMLRMTEDIMKPWSKLSQRQKEKFLVNGIDQQGHSIMQMEIKRFGEKVDGEWMPNTELWGDRTQAMKFRNALNQSVERTIVTPGAGDRALWTSTELGSLITQFKGYGQGATIRVLTSGLQEKDQAFWQGAALMVGIAYFVNETKKLQYGIEKEDTFTEGLINAIDRS